MVFPEYTFPLSSGLLTSVCVKMVCDLLLFDCLRKQSVFFFFIIFL